MASELSMTQAITKAVIGATKVVIMAMREEEVSPKHNTSTHDTKSKYART